MNKGIVALGLIGGVVLLMVIVKKAAAAPAGGSVTIGANQTVTLLYNGSTKTVQAALGSAAISILDFQIWSDDVGDWLESTDPAHDILKTGSRCQVQTIRPCTLYNFGYIA